MAKVALGPHTWAAACINEPKHAYASTFLYTQLRFQKHGKGKFSAIMTEVWNESPIIWEPFQTSFVFHYKKPYMAHFQKHIEIPGEKPKIQYKIVNQKGVFHKTPSSHFYLIGTFSSPNSFSLMLLITFLLVCE